MDEEDFDNDFSNDQEYSEEEDITDLNLEDDENKDNNDNGFKLITYKNILENIQKKTKKSIPYLTKFERARIIGTRLQQLAYGARPNINTKGLNSIQEIVEKELDERKILFIIRRPMPDGSFEDWKLEEFISVK
jgi:DNA-directed RNA polymerase I, II, and III subunit RPABC2